MTFLAIVEVIALFLSIMMTGLIWFVQLVHYPLFKEVPASSFVQYENRHTAKTGLLVAPLMVIELLSTLIVWYSNPSWPGHLTMLLLTIIWLSTFLIQVPLHNKLSEQYDLKAINRLVHSNWIRTVCWTLKSLLMLYYIISFDIL